MVGTIGPIVYGESQAGKIPTTLLMHSIGYVLGGAALGCALGMIGAILSAFSGVNSQRPTILLIAGSLSLILSLKDSSLMRIPTPQWHNQVPPNWFLIFPARITAFLYGTSLGFGVLTYIPVSTFYVALVWVLLMGTPVTGAVVMAVYGFGRALPMLLLSRRSNGYRDSGYLGRALPPWRPFVQFVNGLALSFSGACFLVGSWT